MNKAYSRTPAVLLLARAVAARAQEVGACEPGVSTTDADAVFEDRFEQ